MLKSLKAKAGTVAAVAGVLALGLLGATPADAGRGGWHRDCCWGPRFGVVIGAPPPPVVYAPPPPVYYAPPPPVYYAPPPPPVYAPGVSLGVNIR